MSIAVKSGLPSLGSTEGAVISADEVSVSEDGSAAASVGEDLPRGKSAYEIAKENGFNGTETEWLASLKGEPGAPGAPGKDGENGKTPYVGDNGNWYIGADDTGKPSRGAKGEKGDTDISLGLTSAAVGQIIKVKAVDESGKPTAWEAADMSGGVALDATEKSLLLTMFKNAAYTADMSATIAQLETLWSGTEEPDEPADVSQTGSVLSIVSGVTATQNGAVLAIA